MHLKKRRRRATVAEAPLHPSAGAEKPAKGTMVLKASKGPWQWSTDSHSMSVLLWKDEAKLWQSKPIEAYCSIAIAGLSHFIACTATAGVHHAFACLTCALEIGVCLYQI